MDCIDCGASATPVDKNGDRLGRQRLELSTRDNLHAINPYQVLELRRDATVSEIVHSYQKLALWHHPGRGGSTSLEKQRRRMYLFEILSACYETLIHPESRRRYDIHLKQLERKRMSLRSVLSTSASHATSDGSATRKGRNLPRLLVNRCPSSTTSTLNSQMSQCYHHKPIPNMLKDTDPIPALARSSSSSDMSSPAQAPSEDNMEHKRSDSSVTGSKSQEAGCNLLCSPMLKESLAAQSKSLIVGDSSASRSSADEAEIQFTATTVDRLFGGPLAPLHRARNFEPFSDPFDVFERVFGSPVFPRVTKMQDETVVDRRGNPPTSADRRVEMASAVRSPWNHKPGWTGAAHKDEDGRTTVFVSSRVVRDRKITRIETMHVDPETGKATSEVKVEGETLLDDMSDESEGGHDGACEWIVCHRDQKGNSERQVDGRNLEVGDSATFSRDFDDFYGNAMDDFYKWNRDLYGACTGFMGCTH
ncbi:DnaJ domain containing protein [Nitzschia inconspicua]|uniref:DnaJ domain containing protein n=1 Tax=Nitzschia inconspicua TaxID=303405 RepID=A0A9K3Q3I9_9STRA|nr:DnaJ domain containing protein [Nitzschia inconspicua]